VQPISPDSPNSKSLKRGNVNDSQLACSPPLTMSPEQISRNPTVDYTRYVRHTAVTVPSPKKLEQAGLDHSRILRRGKPDTRGGQSIPRRNVCGMTLPIWEEEIWGGGKRWSSWLVLSVPEESRKCDDQLYLWPWAMSKRQPDDGYCHGMNRIGQGLMRQTHMS
jgi:hypothetical protein